MMQNFKEKVKNKDYIYKMTYDEIKNLSSIYKQNLTAVALKKDFEVQKYINCTMGKCREIYNDTINLQWDIEDKLQEKEDAELEIDKTLKQKSDKLRGSNRTKFKVFQITDMA